MRHAFDACCTRCEAMVRWGQGFRWVGDDKDFVLAAVSTHGSLLQVAEEAFKADKQVVLAAVTSNVRALEHAADALKGDKEVVLAAVANHGPALKYAMGDLN